MPFVITPGLCFVLSGTVWVMGFPLSPALGCPCYHVRVIRLIGLQRGTVALDEVGPEEERGVLGSPMEALKGLYQRLIGLYAYNVDMDLALDCWRTFLETKLMQEGTTPDNFISFARDGEPNQPGATYQVRRRLRSVMDDAKEDGHNVRLHRNAVVTLAFALWEDEYRGRIAGECKFTGRKAKDNIESDVFRDLNMCRQAILHVSGRLDAKLIALRLFRRGDAVSFTGDQMYELFAALIRELNRIGEAYYGKNPEFTFDRPLNP